MELGEGLFLGVGSSSFGNTSKWVGECWLGIHGLGTGIRMGVSGKTFFFMAYPLIQNAPNLSDKSVIHNLCNNCEHLLLVQPFDLQSLNSPSKMCIGINTCPSLVLATCFYLAKGLGGYIEARLIYR